VAADDGDAVFRDGCRRRLTRGSGTKAGDGLTAAWHWEEGGGALGTGQRAVGAQRASCGSGACEVLSGWHCWASREERSRAPSTKIVHSSVTPVYSSVTATYIHRLTNECTGPMFFDWI
jgi:hypothetical protein